ncbi:MAG TPA: TlpA disulfide reductase family protein [Kofleriaceae bacterium]|nr:TlpA disulfide reductase family protein [Kofleriaceae bacterium]
MCRSLRCVTLALCAVSVHACAKSSDSTGKPPDEAAGTKAVAADKGGQGQEAAGTASTAPAAPAAAADKHWYRAAFVPEGSPEIPIYLQLPAAGSSGTGKVVNGQHEADVDAAWTGKDLKVSFPLYHASINATADAQGRLSGSWQVESKTWGAGLVPFHAEPTDAPAPEQRFDQKTLPGQPIDLGEATTVWRAKFPESGVAKITMHQPAPGVFNATVLFTTGNVVYLAGNGRGKQVHMSAFIGLSLYLLTAELDAKKKTLTGKWISGPRLEWREAFKAGRGKDFEVPIAVKTQQRDQLFSMPQLSRYDGKPLIVEVGGSWCDACKHAAGALKEIYDRQHSKGLEIVTLTYEFTDDSAYNKKQAEAFKAAYKLPWEVIPVDGSTDRAWEIIPQGIEGVDASGFPITLFVNPDGSIRSVHASFAGPEHPVEHRRGVKEYEEQAAALVAATKGAAR